MSRRLFYIAQYFTPEPYLKDIKFIKALQAKGWDPIVITTFPNYPKGKVYQGYKNRFTTIEILDGIKIIRVFAYPYHGSGAIKRMLNYFIFSFFSSLAILKHGKRNSLYYILQSSPFVLINAWAIRLFKRNSKILLDIQDIFPENIRISGIIKSKKIIAFIDYILNNYYYKTFDFFIVVSKSFKDVLLSKNIRQEQIQVVYNWSLVENNGIQYPINKPDIFNDAQINIVYAGNIGVNQGLSKLIVAFKMLDTLGKSIKLHFFGDGTDIERLTEINRTNQNVVFHGRVAADKIGLYLTKADILFLHLVKDPAYKQIIPSKLQAYVEFGKPILAGLEGEARDIVETNELGEAFEPENNEAFLYALYCIIKYEESKISLIKDRSIVLYEHEFSRKAGVEKIDKFLSEVYDS